MAERVDSPHLQRDFPSAPTAGARPLKALGVLSECWVLAGEDHAVRELKEGIVHVVSRFPAGP